MTTDAIMRVRATSPPETFLRYSESDPRPKLSLTFAVRRVERVEAVWNQWRRTEGLHHKTGAGAWAREDEVGAVIRGGGWEGKASWSFTSSTVRSLAG